MKLLKSLQRTGAAIVSIGLAGLFASPLAMAQEPPPAQNSGLNKLGTCIAEKHALDVILLMDETGSLVKEYGPNGEETGRPGSDVPGHRIPAAQALIDELVAKQSDLGMDTRVRLAGFGQDYKSSNSAPDQYSDWFEVNDGSADSIKQEIEKFKDRTQEGYTNYANGMQGAGEDLLRSAEGKDPCKMLVTFTDGALTAQESEDTATQALCRPGGVTDRLRAAGITHVGIGLKARESSEDFALFRDITAGGGDCGEVPPNGAFFEAQNVGDLFAAFQSALSTGGEFSAQNRAAEPFKFWLDDSIENVRFALVAKDELSDNAVVTLRSPHGETIQLKEQGQGSLAGSDVEWKSHREPILRSSGSLKKGENASWAGEWSMYLEGISEEEKQAQIFNVVQMQPDLSVAIEGPNGNTEESNGQIQLRDNEQLNLRLVDRDSETHPVQGQAKANVVFLPNKGGEPIELARDVDLAAGTASVPMNGLPELPAVGRVEVQTAVTTRGPEGNPGTQLSPIVNGVALSITPNNLPQLPGEVTFKSESQDTEIEIPVKGPGKVWIAEGSEIAASVLPDGVSSATISSEKNSQESALELQDGESAVLNATVSTDQLRDGTISGNIPLQISSLENTDAAAVDVPVNGTTTIPLNTAKFTGAVIAALLAAILIPLLLLYAIRWFTSRIDKQQQFGAQRFNVESNGTLYTFDGRNTPVIDVDRVNENRINHNGREFHAAGSHLRVKSFSWNPFSETPVLVEEAPSIASTGKQAAKNHAQLPLSVQGQWFLTHNPRSNGIDLVVLPRLPLTQEDKQRMEQDIEDKLPQLFDALQEQLPQTQDNENTPQDSAWGGGEPGASGAQGTGGAQNAANPWGNQDTDNGSFGGFGNSGGFGNAGQQNPPGNSGGFGNPGNNGGFGNQGPNNDPWGRG